MDETWRAAPGFPGYEVSDLGRVRYMLRWKEPRIVAPSKHERGYTKFSIKNDLGVVKTVFGHRLVALTFLPNPHQLPQINHINGVKTDNAVSNLEWVTSRQNIIHARDVIKTLPTGERHHNSRLTEQSVAAIRAMLATGVGSGTVGKAFGINKSHVQDIKQGKLWRVR